MKLLKEVADCFGERSDAGYKFCPSDGLHYHQYVVELFEHVHQQEMLKYILPLYFAHGLFMDSEGGLIKLGCLCCDQVLPWLEEKETSTMDSMH